MFYRLGTVELQIPPLRERREDIPLLIHTFIAAYNQKSHRKIQGIDSYAAQKMEEYPWPGNVRELQHAIEFAMNVIPEQESLITIAYLPDHLCLPAARPEQPEILTDIRSSRRLTKKELRQIERNRIRDALAQQEGNISAAARQLGISRQNLQYRIRKNQIDVQRFREE